MNWRDELDYRADLVQETERAQAAGDRVTAATLRRLFLEIERKRHARLVAP